MTPRPKVVCIRTGSKYGQEYESRLYGGLLRHATAPFDFECHGGPYEGWWNKILLFAPVSRVVYLDLDVVIAGNIDFLFEYNGPFCIMKDPWSGGYNSSVMSIAPGFGGELLDRFLLAPESVMKDYPGDQDFITKYVGVVDTWQQLYPGKIKSYKADNLESGPDGASIVVFHGKPKMADIEEGWVKDAWV